MGFFNFFKRDISEEEFQEQQKVKRGLEKTRTGFFQSIVNTLTNAQIDDDLYDQLEEQLILADVSPACAVRLVDELHDEVEEKHLKTGQEALDALRGIICQELTPRYPMDLDGKPAVILVIGVNGVGKTTTIAKLAGLYKKQGRRVMLAAGDTFRAAASEQLELWAERAGVPLVQAGMGVAGILVVLLSTVTTTFLDAFSAGVSCQSLVPKVSDKVLALIATVLGVILAIFAAPDQFQDFLYLIGSVFAPMTAILLSDFFILKQDHTADSVNWLNLVLWVLGVILYRFLLNVDTPVGITVPVVVILMVISALVHKVLNKA